MWLEIQRSEENIAVVSCQQSFFAGTTPWHFYANTLPAANPWPQPPSLFWE
jgi:hypothetical protein